jgi:hypothetical protein
MMSEERTPVPPSFSLWRSRRVASKISRAFFQSTLTQCVDHIKKCGRIFFEPVQKLHELPHDGFHFEKLDQNFFTTVGEFL